MIDAVHELPGMGASRSCKGTCCSFGTVAEDSGSEEQNVQVLQLIAALGEKHAGRHAILRALALRQDFSEQEITMLQEGSTSRKLRVPAYMWSTLADMGLSESIVPLNIMEVAAGSGEVLMAGDAWADIEFEVALDSGSTDNVCHKADAPGYVTVTSQGSRRGQNFVIGDGNKLPNEGEFVLNLILTATTPASSLRRFRWRR